MTARAAINRDAQSLGPSFVMLAGKYRPDPATLDALARKVIAGGSKVWGEAEMPPHPGLSTARCQDHRRVHAERERSGVSRRCRSRAATRRRCRQTTMAAAGSSFARPTPTGRSRICRRRPPHVDASAALADLTPASADVHSNVSFGSRTSGGGSATRNTAVTAMATEPHRLQAARPHGRSTAIAVATSTGRKHGRARRDHRDPIRARPKARCSVRPP